MMKWSLISLALLALASVSYATNSYLIIGPNLYKVGCDNHLSVYFPRLSEPVHLEFQLRIQHELVQVKTTSQSNKTRNVTLTIPKDFPVGAGQLTIIGTGGLHFEEKRDVIIYDNRHLLLVQTSSSTYRPRDTMEIRVVATNENLLPIENEFLNIEIYDATLKLVGEFPRIPIRSGLTETIRYPLSEHVNFGTWLVSAVLQNTTSSVQVLVSKPITPSFDLKAYFPRYLLRTDRALRGAIELTNDENEPCFGRVNLTITQLTEKNAASPMLKSHRMEVAGRFEFRDDLLSMFNIDITQALALQVSIEAVELSSGHERVLRHVIPIFNHDIMYDIRPLEFQAAAQNEFEILARRPDGKPIRMENLLVTIRLMLGEDQEEKSIDIKDFYTRGRNDMAFFKLEIPENCLGMMVMMTPLDQSEHIQSYRTQAIPLTPTPRRRGEKLTIELLPSKIAPTHTNVNVPVVSSQISTVGRTSNFYIQLTPSKSMDFIEHLPLSYMIMTNGRIIATGELTVQPTKECRPTSTRAIHPEEIVPPTCLYNGTLPIEITREMIPYSTLMIYGFHLPLGYHVVESYRFSVAGLFQTSLILNATASAEEKSRLELSITGGSESLVGLNVFGYDAVLDSLNNEITKERLLKHLTSYEQVPFGDFQSQEVQLFDKRTISESDEQDLIHREEVGYKLRYPVEEMVFGVSSTDPLLPVEGDDVYTTSNMAKLYNPPSSTNYRRKYQKVADQYDVTVDNNEYVVATSIPLVMTMKPSENSNEEKNNKTKLWFEKMNQHMSKYSQEAFTLARAGLSIISDFDSLKLPVEMQSKNFTKLFSPMSSSNRRDQSRQLLEEYISETDSSLVPPPVLLDEQSRASYYQSVYFNRTTLNAQGHAKVLLPQLKPFSSWIATGFALHEKSGLAIAQPIRLPTSQGLFILASFPKHVRVNEHVLLAFAVHNYLEKDLTNVEIRIRSSKDFELFNQTKSLQIERNDFTMKLASMKSLEVVIDQLIVVPKRAGFIQINLEVQSEAGGDHETVSFLVRNADLVQYEFHTRLYDLTGAKKSYGPIVDKLNSSNVQISLSGTGLDRFVRPHTFEVHSLIGIDRTLVRLYRSLAFRRYLNLTSQTHTLLYNMTAENITKAYQSLQLFNDYNGSYSFVSDEGKTYSSLYLTSLAFGAMVSPFMTVRDNVTLNRTLEFILSHQNSDGSFDDQSSCYHYRFCSGKFRRESLTAIVLYALTHDHDLETMPEMIRDRLRMPLARAHDYMISRVPDVLSNYMTISLFEMAFIQNRSISDGLKEKIHQALLKRELVFRENDDSKALKSPGENTTFDDRILLNSMTSSLYSYFKNYQTSSQLCHWIVQELEQHPAYDTVLDAVFLTDAWIRNILLFREQHPVEKFDVNVHIQTDTGDKYHLTINSTNLDLTQTIHLNSSVKEITYTVDGYGILGFSVQQTILKDQFDSDRKLPFQLTQQFQPMQWLNEIKAKTCMTYTPLTAEHKLVDESINRTMVVQVELPSGTRVNLRQLGFFLSRNEQLMYFTYDPCLNRLSFFINVPSAMFGKPICFEWCFERLSTVINWSAVPVHVYDYLQQETRLTHLEKIQFQPQILGYSFVEAAHRARPSLETLAKQ